MYNFSTYPFRAYFTQEPELGPTKGATIIGDDVWIGRDCLICSGAHIPRGCIIGAGSVVRGKFEPYSIIIGNPARCIKKRFSQDIISILETIDFATMTHEQITQNLNLLYTQVDIHIAQELQHALKSSHHCEQMQKCVK
ncbi:hypothetical protein [Helicobacter fennelliae]|uniref:hypothetical protein n=1 Tax=Helicobacter fennelliae TaxID=215 RepID=UPI000E0F666B|nr:hypothetical protein [Helicobacter fennelliae]